MANMVQAQHVAEHLARLGSAALPVTRLGRARYEVLLKIHPRGKQSRAGMNVHILQSFAGFGNPQLIPGELESPRARQRVGGSQAAHRAQGWRGGLSVGANLKLPPLTVLRHARAGVATLFLRAVSKVHRRKGGAGLRPGASGPEGGAGPPAPGNQRISLKGGPT